MNCGFEDDFGSDEYDFKCFPHLNNLLPPPPPQQPRYHYTTTPLTTTTTSTTTTTTPPPTTVSTTTTTTKATTTTSTTTTPVPTTSDTTTEIAFTEKLRQFVFEVSSSTSEIPTRRSTTTVAPLEDSTPVVIYTEKPSNLEKQNLNMTYSENNNFSVDVEEAKLELIQDTLSSSEENIDNNIDETSSGLIIGLACFVAVLIVLAVCLRIYCHYHTVIWIPNPKSLRRKRNKPESNVSDSEVEKEIPEIKGSPEKIRSEKSSGKEIPPSYEVIFPQPDSSDEKCEV